ncbi:MAG: phosphoserine phosphatase SerB [Desulfobacterales bacterium]|nr:phosphoserine phosphatase SerB [Desulfobacterales bacterium]
MNKILLVNFTGKDKTGLVSSLISILAEYDVKILDIGMSVIHEFLTMGVLIGIPENKNGSDLFKDLLFECHSMGVTVNFTPVNLDDYEKWVSEQGKERRIITLLGRKLTAEQIAKVSAVTAKNNLNIDNITRLSGRISMENPDIKPKASVEIVVTGTPPDINLMRSDLMEISAQTEIDISFHVDNIYRRNRKLVVFDMDSTLIQAEVIDELAKLAGVGDQVAEITESAMRGEIDFKESFRKRVSLLKGIKESELSQITENLPITEGTERVVKTLKSLGYKLGILSGGFTFVGEFLKEKFGFDYVYANELHMENGEVTGKVTGDIVDGEQKANLLRKIAVKENLMLEQTIAVGDGANDLPMITIAGLGVAFHAKPIVKERAENSISDIGLDGLLYLIGIQDREVFTE